MHTLYSWLAEEPPETNMRQSAYRGMDHTVHLHIHVRTYTALDYMPQSTAQLSCRWTVVVISAKPAYVYIHTFVHAYIYCTRSL